MLSRRRFLGGAAATAGAAILAACGGGGTATDTAAPAKPTTAAASAASAPATTAPTTGAAAATAPAVATGASPVAATSAAPAATTAATQPAASAAAASPAAKGRVQSQIDTTGTKKGGTIIVGTGGDVTAFNPVTEGNVVTNSFMPLLFDPLVYTDPDTMQPMPNLATKWDVSTDGKTYTFTLKQGVKWHDGQPFTADDVKLSYDLYMNPESGSTRAAGLSGNIASVTVKDPQTVVFTLKDIVASFMTIDMMYGIVPKHILGTIAPKDFKASAFSTSKPVGTGPFKFVEQKLGDHVTLAANPDYHRGAPALDGYIYKVVKDSNVTLQQLKTGELDFASLSLDLTDEAKKQANLNVVDYDTFTMLIFGYNVDPAKGPAIFQDVKVRQALCYAHDRALIAQKIYNGYATVAVGTEAPVTWAYQPDKITMKYPYDPKMAESLLDQAGYAKGSDGIRAKDGKKLSFTLYTVSGSTSTASHVQVVQEALKNIGVEMKAQYEEGAIVVARAQKSFDYDMFFFGLTTSPEPDQTRYWASNQHGPGANYYGYSNPKVDDLLQQGVRTLDLEKRKAIYVDMQNQIVADMPGFVSHFQKGVGAINKRVKNLVPNAVNTNFNAHQWYVTDGK
jgi:peptide/nickel transport system substrate-binding protein